MNLIERLEYNAKPDQMGRTLPWANLAQQAANALKEAQRLVQQLEIESEHNTVELSDGFSQYCQICILMGRMQAAIAATDPPPLPDNNPPDTQQNPGQHHKDA